MRLVLPKKLQLLQRAEVFTAEGIALKIGVPVVGEECWPSAPSAFPQVVPKQWEARPSLLEVRVGAIAGAQLIIIVGIVRPFWLTFRLAVRAEGLCRNFHCDILLGKVCVDFFGEVWLDRQDDTPLESRPPQRPHEYPVRLEVVICRHCQDGCIFGILAYALRSIINRSLLLAGVHTGFVLLRAPRESWFQFQQLWGASSKVMSSFKATAAVVGGDNVQREEQAHGGEQRQSQFKAALGYHD